MAELTSVFGKDELSIVTIECDEGLSEDFEIRIEVVSQKEDLDFDQAIATHMTVKVVTNNGDTRYFDGLLTDARWLGYRDAYYVYKLTLKPWFWLLTKNANCRIFKDKSAPDIISEVLGEHDFSDHRKNLTESYDPIHYCVQYRESDYNFCRRLMEEFGISYFFEHQNGKHTMILADAKSSYSPIVGDSTIPFIPIGGESQRDEEHIYHWVPTRRFLTGKFAMNDYDFEKPSASLEADRDAGSAYRAGSLEHYDYPGRYTEKDKGTTLSKIRLEAEQAADKRIETAGEVPRLFAGGLFTLKDHPHGPQNKEHLVVRASHQIITEQYRTGGGGAQGEAYTGTYDVLASDIPFRTPAVTRKPRIPGPQTAKVVGQGEIDVDEYGQIMVEFHWDRDKTQSRRVRVAQVWSGNNWGGIYIPRVGQEVIVQFLEGDPDQPIIVGTVYNAENMPPYSLPGEKNKAGIKSDSTVGGGGYNEFVMDDSKGQELIGVHAQKDMDTVIENNETLYVKNCRETKIDVDRTEEVGMNTTEKIGFNWKVEAGTMIEFKCGASKITMTPASIEIKSVMIDVKASAVLNAKGTMTNVTGSALLKLKGGLVMIN
ncbi:type VI secretion system Vgr family protein [Roseibium sediminicola]|uniref:Type VI secretion system tip protein VgrG n=1 Tax=Roseibium sediminicola TaxID=2933272 RepID=A0ABT0GRF9_9HYPH|nr:type VI secretion system tip protein TssI/VgrG [Roseibium sp. CAU 1639]MCK7612024.1 type VI secretion system tip protein VgrG [Roseibium sp. CAU 1639]